MHHFVSNHSADEEFPGVDVGMCPMVCFGGKGGEGNVPSSVLARTRAAWIAKMHQQGVNSIPLHECLTSARPPVEGGLLSKPC